MFWRNATRALIAWDSGLGPTFNSGLRAYDHYIVERCVLGGTWSQIGTTRAEAFFDVNLKPGHTYTYAVTGVTIGGARVAVGPNTTLTTLNRRAHDVIAPAPPQHFAAQGASNGIELGWAGAGDAESGLLCYFIGRDNGSQPDAVVWETSAHVQTWIDECLTGTTRGYVIAAVDKALNVSPVVGPVNATAGPVTPPPAGVWAGNIIHNPRVHLNTVDWAWVDGEGGHHAVYRVTSVPWGAMPSGADAALAVECGSFVPGLVTDVFPLNAGDWYEFTFTYGFAAAEGYTLSRIDIEVGLQTDTINLEVIPGDDSPAGASWKVAHGIIWLDCPDTNGGTLAVRVWGDVPGTAYLTKCRLGRSVGSSAYYDGDSSGWEWLGTPHDSNSDTLP